MTEHIRRGDVSGSSFAFRISDERWSKEGGDEIREIAGVDPLFDVGPVTFPAYDATSTGLRAVGGIDEARAAHDAWKGEAGKLAARLAGYRARAVQFGV